MVEVSTTEYGILNRKQTQVTEFRTLRTLTDKEIKRADPSGRIVRFPDGLPLARPVEEIKPPHNPATQVLEGPEIKILEVKVRRVFTVRDKTQAELDAEIDAAKEQQLDRIDALQWTLLFKHENRVRVLEGKSEITATQFRAAVKANL